MSMKYTLLILSVLLAACTDSTCVETAKVAQILAVSGHDKAVKLENGDVRITQAREVNIGKEVCLKWEKVK